MSVSIKYNGRGGNKIFQYVTAKIFCKKNELNLSSSLESELIETKENEKFEYETNGQIITLNHSSFSDDELVFQGRNKIYILDDYFQNCNYINNNLNLIDDFFQTKIFEKNYDDIVLHVRLDDKVHSKNLHTPESWDNAEIIHPNYYIGILEKEKFEKVYIVVDKPKFSWEEKYLNYFKKFNPIFVSNSSKDDFEFIRKFNKIINSTSTFSYWSSFFSDAEYIYTFKKSGYFGNPMKFHGPHVKNLWNIKNKSIVIDNEFYFGD